MDAKTAFLASIDATLHISLGVGLLIIAGQRGSEGPNFIAIAGFVLLLLGLIEKALAISSWLSSRSD